MLIKISAVLAVLAETLLCLFTDIVNSPVDFWIPLVLFLSFFFGIIAAYIIFLFVISLFINKKKPCEKPVRFFEWNVEFIVEALLWFARTEVKFTGVEKIPADRRFLMVSNHRSNMDPMPIITALNNYGIAFVSKPENFKLPLVGAFMHQCCYLGIDRENARNAMRTIHKATDFVKNDIASIVIYPEGKRSKSAELLEFKDGVFYIAKKSKCPIVVVTTENTEKIVKNWPFKKTTVNVDVLAVFEPEYFEDKTTHEISDIARGLMLERLGK